MDARTTPLPPPAPADPSHSAPPTAPTLPAADLPPPGGASFAPASTPPSTPSEGGLPRPEPGTPWSAEAIRPPVDAGVVAPVPVVPTRRRWPLFAALGALAVAALAIGAFVVFGGNDDADTATIEVTPPDDGAETDDAFSFAAATGDASDATSFRFDITMSMPIMGEMRVDGAIDEASGRMSMAMDLGEMADELGGAEAPTGFEMVLDLESGMMYYGGAMAGMFGDGSTAWVGIDLADYAEMAGQSIDEIRSSFVSDPSDLASVFDGLDAVEIGMEEIDGTPVKHYQVTVPFDEVLGADPQIAGQLSGLDVEGLEDLVYDVWVTEDNQLRRLSFAIDVDGMELATVMNLLAVGEAVDIPLPDPAEVTVIDDLLGDLGALGGLLD